VTEPDETPSDWPAAEPEPGGRGLTHWLILLGFLGATLIMILLAVVIEPDPRGYGTHEALGLTPCRLMQWTGVPCPGCGITTSVAHATRGEIWRSLVVQPFGLLTAIALPLLSIWALLVHFRGGDLYATIAYRRGSWIKWTLVLMGVAWVYKLIATLV